MPDANGQSPPEPERERVKRGFAVGIEEVRALARQRSPQAIYQLERLSQHAESEMARIAAAKEILDRAWGKPAQAVEVTGEQRHVFVIERSKPLSYDPLAVRSALAGDDEDVLDVQVEPPRPGGPNGHR